MTKVYLTGDKQADRRLKAIEAKLAGKIVRQATRQALKPVHLAARRNAPKDSGQLRRSIKIRALPRSRSRVGARVTSGSGKSDFTGEAYYGGFQEWGWVAGTNNRRRIKGKEFMGRAAKDKRQSAVTIYRGHIRRELEREARK